MGANRGYDGMERNLYSGNGSNNGVRRCIYILNKSDRACHTGDRRDYYDRGIAIQKLGYGQRKGRAAERLAYWKIQRNKGEYFKSGSGVRG